MDVSERFEVIRLYQERLNGKMETGGNTDFVKKKCSKKNDKIIRISPRRFLKYEFCLPQKHNISSSYIAIGGSLGEDRQRHFKM